MLSTTQSNSGEGMATPKAEAAAKSVPELLMLLASSTQQARAGAGESGTASHEAGTMTRWGRTSATQRSVLQQDIFTNSISQQSAGRTNLRIRSLRRVYNIIFFGGPSHDEIVQRAIAEDNTHLDSDGDGSQNDTSQHEDAVGSLKTVATAGERDSNDESAVASISRSIAAVSLELRRARRYDPANALEGLVDSLLETHPEEGSDESFSVRSTARTLRLFMALRNSEDTEARDTNDWEVIGENGRRVLQKLYNGGSVRNIAQESRTSGILPQQEEQGQKQRQQPCFRATTPTVPAATFFRTGVKKDVLQNRESHDEHASKPSLTFVKAETPVSVAEEDASGDMREVVSTSTVPPRQYFLPNDCVLHLDSTAVASSHCPYGAGDASFDPDSAAATTAPSGFGLERMTWFTDAEFSSKRGIPDIGRRSSVGDYLDTMTTAPLSPTAWTRHAVSASHGTGGSESRSSFDACGSGGGPVPSSRAVGRDGGASTTSEKMMVASGEAIRNRPRRVGGPNEGCALDLCGAFRQARVDVRSPAVRELRIALSYPDLEENDLPDLLKAAQARLSYPKTSLHPNRATKLAAGQQNREASSRKSVRDDVFEMHSPRYSSGTNEAATVIKPGRYLAQQRRTPSIQSRQKLWRENAVAQGTGSLHAGLRPLEVFPSRDGGNGSMVDTNLSEEEGTASPLTLNPVGWEESEAFWNDDLVPKWALASNPLVTNEGGPRHAAFEMCYRGHFEAGGAALAWSPWVEGTSSPAKTGEAEVVRKALAALHGVPSDTFWYDKEQACMRVAVEGYQRSPGMKKLGVDVVGRGGDGEASHASSPPRVAGLSAGALASLLEEFATAGTWYRRVDEFAGLLIDRITTTSQVAQAFGVELRQQLRDIRAVVLGICAGLLTIHPGNSDAMSSSRASTCSAARRRGSSSACDQKKGFLPAPASLGQVLVHTTEVRRASGALAEVCGLADRVFMSPAADGKREGGDIRAAFDAFPQGASLLTHLYKIAEVRSALRPGGVKTAGWREQDVGNALPLPRCEESALTLLSSAATPYLAMLSRWLWSGEMWAEDDPHEEFPLRCREKVAVSAAGGVWGVSGVVSGGDGEKGADPWMEDGGGSFMALAFRDNDAAGVPCFLEGGVLEAAARAGKLLRMLKLSSPEFYTACAASPFPPLSLVLEPQSLASRASMFERLAHLQTMAGRSAIRKIRACAAEAEMRKGSEVVIGRERLRATEKKALEMLTSQRERDDATIEEARRLWVLTLNQDQAAAAAAATATATAAAANDAPAATALQSRKASSLASAAAPPDSSRRGILSFLEPPTSEAEAFAATALRERYRLMGAEADARAARARWKRRRSERTRAARASLKELYAEEARTWEVKVAPARVEVRAAVESEASNVMGDSSPSVAVGACSTGSEGECVVTKDQIEAVAPIEEEGKPRSDENEWVEISTPEVSGDAEILPEERVLSAEPVSERSVSNQWQPGNSRAEGVVDIGGDSDDTTASQSGKPSERLPSEDGASTETQRVSKKPEQDGVSYESSDKSRNSDGVKFSHVAIVQEPGGSSTGASAALSGNRPGSEAGGSGTASSPARDPVPKFSHVKIVEEPGGGSSGVSAALGGSDGAIDNVKGASEPLSNGSGKAIVQEPGGTSAAVSRLLRSGTPEGSAVEAVVPVAVSRPNEAPISGAGVQIADVEDDANKERPAPVEEGCKTISTEPQTRGASEATTKGRGHGHTYPDRPPVSRKASNTQGDGSSASVSRQRRRQRQQQQQQQHPCQRKGVEVVTGAVARGKVETSQSPLPLNVMIRRCVREPILAQCSAVDSAALAFLLRGAGVAEHLTSLRTFLLGLNSDFLHDFTARLLEGIYNGRVDWRRPSNLNAAFAASATAAGLDSVSLVETFRYEVDPTCGGVLGRSFVDGNDRIGEGSSSGGAALSHSSSHETAAMSESSDDGRYSSRALSFVSPVLAVPWPVGVLLPTGVLHTYGNIHRALFRHHLVLHRLRRLRLTLRQLSAGIDGVVDRSHRRVKTRVGRGQRGGGGRHEGTRISWDGGRLHWMHLFRYEMQHMADTLQTFFVEQAEIGWPDLQRSLAVAEGKVASSSGQTTAAAAALGTGAEVRAGGSGGLAILMAAHSRYISNMHLRMFLSGDKSGVIARARIEEFYHAVCTVSKITDGLVRPAPPSHEVSGSGRIGSYRSRETETGHGRSTRCDTTELGRRDIESRGENMILPDDAFAELASARETFDAARRGLCGALMDISDGGGHAYTIPLVAALGYGEHDETSG